MTLSDLPNPQRRAVEIVKEVASEKGIRPFLVGGPVRDLILGRSSVDLDLTVEDDSSVLARALAKRLSGRVKSFPQFLTYKVIAEELPEIDIATARREKYRAPGALPTVTPGTLRLDLLRRDFSINAIALDLMTGTLHDPTNGGADLRAGVVRILHEASFIDDPTRIYRALRLSTRLGFRIDDGTAALMREAISGAALSTISRERIWRELFLAMDEDDAPRVLEAFVAAGSLEIVFGRRQVHGERLEAAQSLVSGDSGLDRYAIFTGALLGGDASPIDLEGSGFSQKRARVVVQIANELPRFSEALHEAKSERQRLRVLRHASPEVLGMLAALRPENRPDVLRFRDFQDFRLQLRGTDLEVPGGPHVSRALERTREAVFTNEIPADEARTFAREMAIKYLSRDSATERK